MKSLGNTIVIALTVFCSVVDALPTASAPTGKVPNRYIIQLKPSTDFTKLTSHLSWLNSVHKRDVEKRALDTGIFSGIQHQYSFHDYLGYSGGFSDAVVNLIRLRPDVLRVEQDTYLAEPKLDSEPVLSTRDADADADAVPVQRVSKRAAILQSNAAQNLVAISQKPYPNDGKYWYDETAAAGSYSYVIDTGILLSHQEFEGRAYLGWTNNASDTSDTGGHGTFVASIIGGKTYGVAKKTTLVAVKMFGDSWAPTTAVLVAAINWSVNDIKAKSRVNKAVLNLSVGAPANPSVNDAVIAAYKANITCVAGAGNSNADVGTDSPASVAEAITVGGIGSNYAAYARWANSNYGAAVDIFAPSENIKGAWIGAGNNQYNTGSGTSAAAPHVAGQVAAWMVINPLTPPAIAKSLDQASWKGYISGLPSGTANKFMYNLSWH